MKPNDLSFLSGKLAQVAYVVRDFEPAVRFFKASLGIRTFYIWNMLTEKQTDKIYRGKPGRFEFSAGYAYSGNMQIELCKHESGNNVYKDWLDEKGESMHHIGFRLETAAEYEAALLHYREHGIVEAMSGWFKAPANAPMGNCKWVYVDTRKLIGCYTELYYVDGVALEAFENFRAGKSDEFIPGAPSQRPTH